LISHLCVVVASGIIGCSDYNVNAGRKLQRSNYAVVYAVFTGDQLPIEHNHHCTDHYTQLNPDERRDDRPSECESSK
jgi:hypothetical protein